VKRALFELVGFGIVTVERYSGLSVVEGNEIGLNNEIGLFQLDVDMVMVVPSYPMLVSEGGCEVGINNDGGEKKRKRSESENEMKSVKEKVEEMKKGNKREIIG